MKNSTHDKLVGEFERLARVMSGNYNVKVVPSNSCSTDGRTIFYPFNADDMANASKKALHGFLDHECAHVEEEDRHEFEGMKTPLSIMKSCKNKKEKMLLNVFEDIRIETRKSQELIGVAENLKESCVWGAKLNLKKIEAESYDFWHMFGCAIVFLSRGIEFEVPSEFEKYIDKIQDEIEESTKTKWAEDSLRLAKSVIEKTNDVAEEELKECEEILEKLENKDEDDGSCGSDSSESKDAGDSDDAGDPDDNSDSSEDNNGDDGTGGSEDGTESETEDVSDDGDAKHDFEETSEEGKGATKKTEGKSDSDEKTEEDSKKESVKKRSSIAGSAKGDSSTPDLNDAVKEQLSEDAGETAKTTGYCAPPRIKNQDIWNFSPPENKSAFEKARNDVASQLSGMKSKLLRVVKSNQLSVTMSDQDEGDEIDSDALATVPTGNRRIFTKNVKGETLDTAVMILVDESGSMRNSSDLGSCAYFAQRMVIGISETLDALSIPFEVIGYTNHFASIDYVPLENEREEIFEYNVYKKFTDRYKKVRNRFGSITGKANNVDGEAVMEAAKRLAVRQEPRKILMVVSDGIPMGGLVSEHVLCHDLSDSVRKVSDSGIEIVGIGAGSKHIKRFYENWIYVNDLNTLAVDVYKGMRELLLDGKKKKTRRTA